MDSRESRRAPFHSEVILSSRDLAFKSRSLDISLGGLLILGESYHIDFGSLYRIFLKLSGKTYSVDAKPVRQQEGRVAFEFQDNQRIKAALQDYIDQSSNELLRFLKGFEDNTWDDELIKKVALKLGFSVGEKAHSMRSRALFYYQHLKDD